MRATTLRVNIMWIGSRSRDIGSSVVVVVARLLPFRERDRTTTTATATSGTAASSLAFATVALADILLRRSQR